MRSRGRCAHPRGDRCSDRRTGSERGRGAVGGAVDLITAGGGGIIASRLFFLLLVIRRATARLGGRSHQGARHDARGRRGRRHPQGSRRHGQGHQSLAGGHSTCYPRARTADHTALHRLCGVEGGDNLQVFPQGPVPPGRQLPLCAPGRACACCTCCARARARTRTRAHIQGTRWRPWQRGCDNDVTTTTTAFAAAGH